MILRKTHCFGHIIRKGGIERCIIEGQVDGKRRSRRPLKSWANDIVKLVGGSSNGREGWRALVIATVAN